MSWLDTPVPASTCPSCGALLDTAGNQKGETPGPDQISICAYCAALLIFDAEMKLREITPAELIEWQRSPAWRDVERSVHAVKIMIAMGVTLPCSKKRPAPIP